jgi:hypothetical protein
MPFVSGMVSWRKNCEREWQRIQLIELDVFEQLLRVCRPPDNKGSGLIATADNRTLLWMMLVMDLLISEVCVLQVGSEDAL